MNDENTLDDELNQILQEYEEFTEELSATNTAEQMKANILRNPKRYWDSFQYLNTEEQKRFNQEMKGSDVRFTTEGIYVESKLVYQRTE